MHTTLQAVIVTSLTCIFALAQPWPIAMSGYAHASQRHPVPGEIQSMRWSVHNDGADRLDRVRLAIRPPHDWKLRSAPGCRPAAGLLRCALGPLAPGKWASVTVRMAVPPDPRLGTFRITGRTAMTTRNACLSGPSATLTVTVVRRR